MLMADIIFSALSSLSCDTASEICDYSMSHIHRNIVWLYLRSEQHYDNMK